MKKLNNRGFAISTVVYSLLIMVFLIVALLMGIMSSNRQNTKSMVSQIEEELNRYSLTTTEFVPSEGGVAEGQEFIVPYGKSGWYKIELWGAAGGDVNGSVKGGAGSYTSGIIYLTENTHLYFYIGGQGSGTTGGANGGANGNGTGQGGGGATDVRVNSGAWDDSSLTTRIMVAGGGGGANGTTAGQSGGAIEAYQLNNSVDGNGATQTTGGTGATAGELGKGGAGGTNGAGGGGGYYGGGGGNSGGTGGGGSSYISGYAGVTPTKTAERYFLDGMMAENVNTGTGKAKIEMISTNPLGTPPNKQNTEMTSQIRYIKDCVSGIGNENDTTKLAPQWIEIQAIKDGVNVAAGATVSSATTDTTVIDGSLSTAVTAGTYGTESCVIIDLGTTYDYLDEIAVWHNTSSTTELNKKILLKNTISVAKTDSASEYRTVKNYNATEPYSGPEGLNGTRITAWNQNVQDALNEGTYYIFSALSPNTSLISAQSSLTQTDTNSDGVVDGRDHLTRYVKLSQIDGSNLQKWTITKVGAYYKIIERESNQAMQIIDNIGQVGSNINTSSAYTENNEWANWSIIPLGDGTYRIKPYIQQAGVETYLSTQDKNFGVNNTSMVLASYSTTDETHAQRFYIVRAEY